MANVKEYAKNLNLTVEVLIKRLEEAGIHGKTELDVISDTEKKALVALTMNSSKRLSLKQTTTSTLNQGRGTVSKAKGVSVVVRKKRVVPNRIKQKPIVSSEQLKQRKTSQDQRLQEQEKLKKLEQERIQAQLDKKEKIEQELKAKQQAEVELKKQAKPEEVAPPPPPPIVASESKKKQAKRKKSSTDNLGRKQLHVRKGVSKKRASQLLKDDSKKITISGADDHGFTKPTKPIIIDVNVPETITVSELAQRMSIKAADLLKVMMGHGIMATINQNIDQDTAYLLVEEMGHNPIAVSDTTLEDKILQQTSDNSDSEAISRPPVVTIMGHVDHGKTSLLDYIRNSQVTKGEAGGITQHIGAYKVATKEGAITFIDTPGHAAFTAMRARGAKVTDIVIIVASADDGVMPQTIEAIEHAKAAKVPIIVAITKIDKPEANSEKIKTEMAKHELTPEDWGGDTSFIGVSSMTGEGVEELLESILLHAEILELKAPIKSKAKGTIVESRIDKGRGSVATVIVQSGTLKKGNIVLSGREFGKIRSMIDDQGNSITEALPSTPVEVLGLSGAPDAGSDVIVVEKERQARELANERIAQFRDLNLAKQKQASLNKMFSQMQEGELSEVNVLVKSDVHGSAEAIRESLSKLSNEEVQVNVVSSGVGGINESDANLSLASGAIILGFNVRADASAKKIIALNNIEIHYFSIIYDLIDLVKNLVLGEMKDVFEDNIIGIASVKDVFKAPKYGAIAGCLVSEGTIRRNHPIRVLRDNVVIYEGELESLRRFKDDVNEVKSGTECGIGVKSYNDVQVGDQIEVFERTKIERSI